MKFLARLSSHPSWGSLILRLSVGAIFIVHGMAKWQVWSAPAGGPMSGGMGNLMKLLSIVEPLGGLALILGFLTPLAALGLAIIMIGAIYFKINVFKVGFAAQNTTGWEFDFILLAANLCLMLSGAGKWSLDRKMMKK